MRQSRPPRFHLYGEPAHAMPDTFIHVETIAARSGTRDWTIRPHMHAGLQHLLFVHAGEGAMQIAAAHYPFAAGVLAVPAGVVHGFRFAAGTDGHVLTIAEPLGRSLALRHPAVEALVTRAHVLPAVADRRALLDMLAGEGDAMDGFAGMAGEAILTLLLAAACRALPADGEGTGIGAGPGRAARLVARYRRQIDARLAEGWSVGDHAAALGVSPARLRAACAEAAGQSPLALLQARLLAEAQRQLLHSDRTAAAIAFDLGFSDAAYFSRMFRKATGRPPAAWRADRARQA